MSDMKHDVDALETQEWLAALESVVREEGVERAQYLLEQVLEKARLDGVDMPTGVTTNYINTIPAAQEPAYPGDTAIERRIRSIIRWNAIMIVLRASKKIWNWVATWLLSNLPLLSTKPVSTTSSVLQTRKTVATWFTIKVTSLRDLRACFR